MSIHALALPQISLSGKRLFLAGLLFSCLRIEGAELPKPDAKQAAHCASVRPGESIQAAIDSCAKTKRLTYVELTAGDFTSGPLFLRTNVLLKLDQGATLNASTRAADYNRPKDETPCGSLSPSQRHCLALINGKDVQHSGVIGGIIDGRGYSSLTGLSDPAEGQSWWVRAKTAKMKYRSTRFLAAPRLIEVRGGEDLTFTGITIRNAPEFHLFLVRCSRVLMDHLVLDTPDSGHPAEVEAGGIEVGASNNVTISNCYLKTGNDNIAIKSGEAGTETANITISHCYFYAGHGLSIGSETAGNVRNVQVRDVVFDGSENGFRIKSDRSRGGLVSDVTYEQACMRSVKRPLVFDAHYDRNAKGQSIPKFEKITVKDLTADRGEAIFNGDSVEVPARITLDNVLLRTPRVRASNVQVMALSPAGEGQLPIPPSSGVVITPGVSSSSAPKACPDSVFTAFPYP